MAIELYNCVFGGFEFGSRRIRMKIGNDGREVMQEYAHTHTQQAGIRDQTEEEADVTAGNESRYSRWIFRVMFISLKSAIIVLDCVARQTYRPPSSSVTSLMLRLLSIT